MSMNFEGKELRDEVFSLRKASVSWGFQEYRAEIVRGKPLRLRWDDGTDWFRDELQGSWHRSDGAWAGAVADGHLTWCSTAESHRGRLQPPLGHLPGATVQVVGEPWRCSFHPGSPALLRWADGEVWLRSAW